MTMRNQKHTEYCEHGRHITLGCGHCSAQTRRTEDLDMTLVKNEGIRKELFSRVQDTLWHSQRAIERAREIKDGHHVNFETMVAEAKALVKQAERFYTELRNYEHEEPGDSKANR